MSQTRTGKRSGWPPAARVSGIGEDTILAILSREECETGRGPGASTKTREDILQMGISENRDGVPRIEDARRRWPPPRQKEFRSLKERLATFEPKKKCLAFRGLPVEQAD